jgi:hypothetical protein
MRVPYFTKKRNVGQWLEEFGQISIIPGIVIFKVEALFICGLIALTFVSAAAIYYKKQGTLNEFWIRKAPVMGAGLLFSLGLFAWHHFYRS